MRTFATPIRMSALCQKRTLHQPFDHLARSYLQRLWDCKPKSFCDFVVYNEFNFVGCTTGKSAGFFMRSVNHWHAIQSSQRDDLIGIGKRSGSVRRETKWEIASFQSSVPMVMLGMNRRAPPHKRMLRSLLSGASNMPKITDRRRINLRDRR
jgi:hypothetical protein